jgi:oxygen-independent coproporphyrinogen III oxidase
MSDPAGIYTHLPYCRSRCGYCAFVVTTDDSSRAAYLAALLREIALVAPEAQGHRFDSLYLGGGTPSLLPAADIAALLDGLRGSFPVLPGAEVTLEANPDDVSAPLAEAWRDAGVTRVSVGVQSFADRELSAVGRRHDSAAAQRALETLRRAELSISADLILGLPEQTAETFDASVQRLCDSGVGHVSVYLLEADKSKEIEEDRRRNPERYLSDDAQADLWLDLCERLEARGFEHYEISNWALPGQAARHNVKYWKRTPTLGLGISAHELWRERRRANVSAIAPYVEGLAAGRRPVALDHEVGPEERARERIVLGLRLAEGVGREELESWIAGAEDETLPDDYASWREAGLLADSADRVRLTERGFLLSNEFLCRFV